MEKKQTAVEWLVIELEKHYINIDILNTVAYQQAKQMELNQHKDTYIAAMCRPVDMDKSPIDQAEKYYKETYGK